MTSRFDELIERRGTGSEKWQKHAADVLPLWVADMDFRAPEAVQAALHQLVDFGVFGYPSPAVELSAVICERMERLYHWCVSPEQIVYLPGLVPGLNLACRMVAEPGAAVVVQTPVYPPFLHAPGHQGLQLQTAQLALCTEGRAVRYEIDFDAFEAALTPQTRLFLLCHPHNPIGQVFAPNDLMRLAEVCARHNLLICSDEIHCDLLLDDIRHMPLAALSPEISERAITLMAPSKTFNVAGLSCSFAIIQNEAVRQRFAQACEGVLPFVNLMGQTAALAAYRHGQPWLDELLPYLRANRDALTQFVMEQMPNLRLAHTQATYLAWLDCRAALPEKAAEFFLREAKVALNEGATFGPGGEGFVRLNFGCPRSRLLEGLERMRVALAQHAHV